MMRLNEIERPHMLGYKIMRFEDGFAISGANSRLAFKPQIGQTVTMPGHGIYMSPNREYVETYYGGHHETEILLKFSFDPVDIIWGNLEDRESEIAVSKAKVIDFEIRDEE